MTTTRHVRFHLSELVQALECYGKMRRPSVCDALSFYYNWVQARGWKMLAGFGYPVKGCKIWIGTGDRDAVQLEMQEQEVLYEVVWSADEPDGTCDFLEAFPVVDAVARIIEVLEGRGWDMDEKADGYVKRFPFGDGYEDRHIAGSQIYQAALKLKPEGELDAVVEAIVDQLERA